MAEKEIKEEEKITLCPDCGLCPEITIDRKEQKVVFYEDGKDSY
jgi:threonine synthase